MRLQPEPSLEHDHGRVMDLLGGAGKIRTGGDTHTVAILTSGRNEGVCRTARVDHVAFGGLLLAGA